MVFFIFNKRNIMCWLNKVNYMYIKKHTEAEKDDYLIDCFHDAGFIKKLTESQFSIVTGRKGSGKTAVARYLEEKYKDYGIDNAFRLSIRNISLREEEDRAGRVNSILSFILIKTIRKLLEHNVFQKESEKYWRDFLILNGLQQVSDYETFVESQKTNKDGFSIKGFISSMFAKVEGSVKSEQASIASRAIISKSPQCFT